MIRSKWRLTSVTDYGSSRKMKFSPVCADDIPENQRFHKYTPSGDMEMTVTNEAIYDQFVVGKCYYFDQTPVPETEPAKS